MRQIQLFPMNRVEGDLTVRVEIRDRKVTDAWSAGTMYRGFENLMRGRGPLDGLVITPRICGICSTSHLMAAARALDVISKAEAPDQGRRVRNICLMVEHIQSDIRHAFLLFATDFTNPAYESTPFFAEARKRFLPLKGETALQAITQTGNLLQVIAILGGQWPHSSFIVPGGIVSLPSADEILQCRFIVKRFRKWYEDRVLGCKLDSLADVILNSDLDPWRYPKDGRFDSDLGFFIRFAEAAGLDKTGKGHGNFISYGAFENSGEKEGEHLFTPGFFSEGEFHSFDERKIEEEISHSWFIGYQKGLSPEKGITEPYATGDEGVKYSWVKAPRYQGLPAETGPLAEMLVSGVPLFLDLYQKKGANVFLRQLARILRPAYLLEPLDNLLTAVASKREPFYREHEKIIEGSGFGLIEAPRGGLGHWVTISDGRIQRYQIITPSAWNGSPRDGKGVRGPWEEALIGTTIEDPENPVAAEHVIRSFDPCMVCAVHVLTPGR